MIANGHLKLYSQNKCGSRSISSRIESLVAITEIVNLAIKQITTYIHLRFFLGVKFEMSVGFIDKLG